jgi:hypothetical protein
VDKLIKFHPRKVTNPADNKELNKEQSFMISGMYKMRPRPIKKQELRTVNQPQ